jgi:multidrug efflux pump subunit AcrA (membrane-fusion protein)
VVPAPIAGVITSRSANLGQVVGMGDALFVVTDLSEVWVVGDLYEQDFSRVRVGAEATLTTLAYPELRLQGRVSYIDPRVDPQTRTAKVRVEVPNPHGQLRLGMYMTMVFSTVSGAPVVVVPRAAVQTIGGGAGGLRRSAGRGREVRPTYGETWFACRGIVYRARGTSTGGGGGDRRELFPPGGEPQKRAVRLTGSLVFHRKRVTGGMPTGIVHREERDVRVPNGESIPTDEGYFLSFSLLPKTVVFGRFYNNVMCRGTRSSQSP